MKLVGVDVGGTFTDVMFSDTVKKSVLIHKVPTTGDDPSRGVMTGILELCERNGIDAGEIDYVFHGTTIATNAILEYRGAEAGMITTRGFRDIIHIGRHQRPQHYSIMQDIPWQDRPLVKRRYRKMVTERLAPPKGDVLVPLAEDEVRKAAREFQAAGITSIAICFLFSYLNPAHEVRARELVLEEYPEAFVTTSSSIVAQFREFERFTTAAMNAYIGPPVRNYVRQLDEAIRNAGMRAELRIMRSNGGVATPATITEYPVLTLLSGPAAGVLGGAVAGALSDRRNLITFDVGGTSADIGVTNEGHFSEASARDTRIAGYPVLVPMIDIHTIGAGGGSVAYLDQGGSFHVGPRSAGSKPGPAAYMRGGQEPTVTDANVVLGRLDKDNFLGGEMGLDVEAAQRVVSDIASRLGMSVDEAAAGIVTILNSNMANAIRSRTVQKGIDPRDFSLMAFGGAGPLHGAEVADMLGIPEVIVPAYPGITSALGLLASELKYDAIRTQFQISSDIDHDRLNADFTSMEEDILRQFEADSVKPGDVQLRRFADARYVGQGYELRIDLASGMLGRKDTGAAFEQFHRVHEAEYGHAFPTAPIEIVNIRVTGTAPSPQLEWPKVGEGGSLEKALIKRDRTKFRVDGELRSFDTAFYRRADLPLEQEIAGPAIVLQLDTTTVVPPNWHLLADAHGNLILTSGDAR
jgi:N-methylhydantoinase A